MSTLREIAEALWSMASGNDVLQREIVDEGGVQPLIMMLAKAGHSMLHGEEGGGGGDGEEGGGLGSGVDGGE